MVEFGTVLVLKHIPKDTCIAAQPKSQCRMGLQACPASQVLKMAAPKQKPQRPPQSANHAARSAAKQTCPDIPPRAFNQGNAQAFRES